jgi:ParB family chromosome partitioning protein
MTPRRLTLTVDDPLAPGPTAAPAGPACADATDRPPLRAAFDALRARGRLRTVRLDQVRPNPRQPRRRFDEEALAQLTDSIRERGILQPPVVRPLPDGTFELIAGERRWRAAHQAGLSELEVLIRATDDAGALQDAVVENIARDDLSPVDEARAYATLIDDLAITQDELGRRIGRGRASIANHLRLLELPDDVLELLDRRELSYAHGRALLLCDEQSTRRDLARRAVAEGWSKRQLEDAARAAGAPRSRQRRSRIDADHQALASELEERVNRHTGLAVSVRPAARDGFAFVVRGAAAAHRIAFLLGAEVRGEGL